MEKKYITRDSGKKQKFDSGYQRDTQKGKARFDLIPTGPLRRVADLYARGAEKYGESNWELGAPVSRMYASLFRHLIQFAEGDKAEDHLAAVVWNAFAIMHFQDQIEKGNLPEELNDMKCDKE